MLLIFSTTAGGKEFSIPNKIPILFMTKLLKGPLRANTSSIFYDLVLDLLLADPNTSIDPLPTFRSASVGKGENKRAGGCGIVQKMVAKLAGTGLEELAHGLVDRDLGARANNNIHVLPRYSIENYIFDPLVIFECLLNQSRARTIDGVSLAPGDSCRIRELPNESLQSIVDIVSKPILEKIAADHSQTMAVVFTNGKSVNLCIAFRDHHGHTLSQAVYEIYKTSRAELLQSMKRLRMIPRDLADLFSEIAAE
jgi:hypothetical protein